VLKKLSEMLEIISILLYINLFLDKYYTNLVYTYSFSFFTGNYESYNYKEGKNENKQSMLSFPYPLVFKAKSCSSSGFRYDRSTPIITIDGIEYEGPQRVMQALEISQETLDEWISLGKAKSIILNASEFNKRQQRLIVKKIERNGHIYIEGTYQNKKSELTIYCPTHDFSIETTFEKYRRAKLSCPICSKESKSNALIDRVFSDETIEKMRKSALARPLRGGRSDYWRRNADYRAFESNVWKYYNGQCAITGETIDLNVHHLYGAKDYEYFQYIDLNGILISKTLHVAFHNRFGYRNNTIHQFKDFLHNLVDGTLVIKELDGKTTSSQIETEISIGSKTNKFYKSKKIFELLESLDIIEEKLELILEALKEQ
jgi:hypothetical protein